MNNSSKRSFGRDRRPMTIDQITRWSYIAHLTAFINGFTLILGVITALVLYLVFRRRSPLVAFHALQSLFMQLVLWVGGFILAVIALTISNQAFKLTSYAFCLGPFAFLIGLIPISSFIYAGLGAWEIRHGNDFQYYKAGEWALHVLQRQND